MNIKDYVDRYTIYRGKPIEIIVANMLYNEYNNITITPEIITEVNKIIKQNNCDRVAIAIELLKIDNTNIGKTLSKAFGTNLSKLWNNFVIVQEKFTGEFSIRNHKFIRGHERKFKQVSEIYKDVNELLKDLYDFKYRGKEISVDTSDWRYYAIQAGYNPDCGLPWVEVKKFENEIEASKAIEEHSNESMLQPIVLSTDYYRSIGILVAKHQYPKYAIKNLNV